MGSLDARLKAELSAQTQKLDAMRVSMEAGEQEHLKLTETLNQKVRSDSLFLRGKVKFLIKGLMSMRDS